MDPELSTLEAETRYLAKVLNERLVGRRVLRVETQYDEDVLILDDGQKLRLYMSEWDCCASAHGVWVTYPENLDCMITDVRAEVDPRSGDDGDGTTNYVRINLMHNQNPVAQANCDANDGNGGYYYSCLSLDISHMIGTSQHDITLKVVDA